MAKRDEHPSDDSHGGKRRRGATGDRATEIEHADETNSETMTSSSGEMLNNQKGKQKENMVIESTTEPTEPTASGSAGKSGSASPKISQPGPNVKAKTIRKVTLKGKEDGAVTKATVQTIIPNTTMTLYDQYQVVRYDENLMRRVDTLSNFVNKEASVYALGKILPTATWGRFQPFEDHRNELCNPVTNKPIVVWTVGHIASTWFLRNGEPDKQASVTVVPLSESLADQAVRLLNGLANPPDEQSEDTIGAVRAVKWQNTKGSDTCTLFNDVYDAREVLATKAEMAMYPADALKRNDLVLLESKITRYRVKDANNKWKIQRVQMELLSISLLYAAEPGDVKETDEDHSVTGLRI